MCRVQVQQGEAEADKGAAASGAGQHLELGGLGELAGVREAEQVVAQLQHLLLHCAVQPQRVAHRAHECQRWRTQLLLQGKMYIVGAERWRTSRSEGGETGGHIVSLAVSSQEMSHRHSRMGSRPITSER